MSFPNSAAATGQPQGSDIASTRCTRFAAGAMRPALVCEKCAFSKRGNNCIFCGSWSPKPVRGALCAQCSDLRCAKCDKSYGSIVATKYPAFLCDACGAEGRCCKLQTK